MAYSASLRRPVNGSGTLSVTGMGGNRPARLVFSQAQTFKRGAIIVITIDSDREKYTIDHGKGTE